MNLFTLIRAVAMTLFLALMTAPKLGAMEVDGWATRPPVFKADGDLTSVPILLYFSASWCSFCKQMDRTTLADESVRAEWAGMSRVKLDLDEQATLAKQFVEAGYRTGAFVLDRAPGALGKYDGRRPRTAAAP